MQFEFQKNLHMFTQYFFILQLFSKNFQSEQKKILYKTQWTLN